MAIPCRAKTPPSGMSWIRPGSVLMILTALWVGMLLPVPARGIDFPRVRHVLLVSVDGLRPDLLLSAHAPVVHGLMRRGSYTMWAQTTDVAVTLPSHTSMVTGVTPAKHGVTWNTDPPPNQVLYPARPTLFELARRAGLTTAMVAGKSKFSVLAKPGTLTWWSLPAAGVITDQAVTDTAVRFIQRDAPNVMFVHLPGVDTAGHAAGWASPSQLDAIAIADHCVGRLLTALRKRGLLDSTEVLVTSDHGGAGKSHGPDDPRSRHIPWIIAGPGVRQDFDLTRDANLVVHTEDTFATLAAMLGISSPEPIDGHPVEQIVAVTH